MADNSSFIDALFRFKKPEEPSKPIDWFDRLVTTPLVKVPKAGTELALKAANAAFDSSQRMIGDFGQALPGAEDVGLPTTFNLGLGPLGLAKVVGRIAGKPSKPNAGSPEQRAYKVADTLLGGLPSAYEQAVAHRQTKAAIKGSNLDKYISYVGGAMDVIADDLLPGREINTLLFDKVYEGVDQAGNDIWRPAEPVEKLMAVASGALKSVPLAIGVRNLIKWNPKIATNASLAASPTIREIESGEVLRNSSRPGGLTLTEAEALVRENSIPVEKLLSLEDAMAIANETGRNELNFQLWKKAMKKNPELQISQHEQDFIRQYGLSDDLTSRVAIEGKTSLEKASEAIAEVMDQSDTYSAIEMAINSAKKNNFMAKLEAEAVAGRQDAIELLQRLKDLERTSRSTTLGRLFEDVVNWKRTIDITQPVTASRNTVSQGLQFSLTSIESRVADGLGRLLGDKIARQLPPIREFPGFNRLLSIVDRGKKQAAADLEDVIELGAANNATLYNASNELLDQLPRTKNRLLDIAAYETTVDLASNLGGQVKGTLNTIKHYLTLLNRVQEREWRTALFGARVDANFRKLGMKNGILDAIPQVASADKLPDLWRIAIAEAEDYAMKNTFSYTPREGPAAGILNAFKQMPVLGAAATAFGPTPYPRFLANVYRTVHERAPYQWLKMLNPSFRDAVLGRNQAKLRTIKTNSKGEGVQFNIEDSQGKVLNSKPLTKREAQIELETFNSPFATREAREQLTRAITGTTIFAAAYYMQELGMQGPRYYLWKPVERAASILAGATEPGGGEQTWIDSRSLQPWVSFAALAKVARSSLHGTLSEDFTPQEMIEAVASIRNSDEVAIFNIDEMIQALSYENPEARTRAMKRWAGRFVGSIALGAPANAMRDLLGGSAKAAAKVLDPASEIGKALDAYGTRALAYRDTRRDEFQGQILAPYLGIAGADESILPFRRDPLTGETRGVERPITKQLIGQTRQDMTTTEEEFLRLNIDRSSLLDDYFNPEATRIMTQVTGNAFNQISPSLIEVLDRIQLHPEVRKNILRSMYRDVANNVYDAVSTDPELSPLFAEYKIRNKRPTSSEPYWTPQMKETILNELRKQRGRTPAK